MIREVCFVRNSDSRLGVRDGWRSEVSVPKKVATETGNPKCPGTIVFTFACASLCGRRRCRGAPSVQLRAGARARVEAGRRHPTPAPHARTPHPPDDITSCQDGLSLACLRLVSFCRLSSFLLFFVFVFSPGGKAFLLRPLRPRGSGGGCQGAGGRAVGAGGRGAGAGQLLSSV